MEISTDTFQRKIAPQPVARGQPTSEKTKPLVHVGTADVHVQTSKWGTIVSFVMADVFGVLLTFGAMSLLMEGMPLLGAVDLSVLSTVLLPLFLASFAFTGLYRQRFMHPALEMQRVAVVTGTVGATAALTVYFVTEDPGLILLVSVGALIGILVIPLSRVMTRILCSQMSWWGFPAVIVTRGTSGNGILNTLQRWPEIGLRPVALLTDAETEQPDGIAVHGHYELGPYLARTFDIPYAVVAVPTLTHSERANLLLRYTKFFDHVLVLPDDAGAPALWTTGQSGEGLFGYSVRHAALQPGARFVKRAIDIVGAGLATLVLLPVLAAIAIAIRRDSPGPAFYSQERMGKEGRIFSVRKFRTMYEDADQKLAEILEADPERRREYEQYHKLGDDPRVTSVGRVLRRYSLDELPQLFNVLRGDMSLVGPRAYMPCELPKMRSLARAILQCPPGVTGLWQVSGRNHLSFAERVNLDVHYMQNWSLWLDLYLLVRTIPTVLTGEGAS